MSVSRWNSAVINRHFLAYNFRPKTERPVERTGGLVRADAPPPKVVVAASLADYRLPPKAVFDRAMPRYPNVWFYLDTALADLYNGAAVRLVADQLRGPMRLLEDHGRLEPGRLLIPDRLEHLQPWESAEHRPLQHAHAFHLRYYHSALEKQQLDQATLSRQPAIAASTASPRARTTKSSTRTRTTQTWRSVPSAAARGSIRTSRAIWSRWCTIRLEWNCC